MTRSTSSWRENSFSQKMTDPLRKKKQFSAINIFTVRKEKTTMNYTMEIAGVKRNLELFPINETTCIAAFIMFGDVEITQAAAAKLLERAPEFDIIFTAEAKSIPLAYEMAKQAGRNDYVVARKAKKMYMKKLALRLIP